MSVKRCLLSDDTLRSFQESGPLSIHANDAVRLIAGELLRWREYDQEWIPLEDT